MSTRAPSTRAARATYRLARRRNVVVSRPLIGPICMSSTIAIWSSHFHSVTLRGHPYCKTPSQLSTFCMLPCATSYERQQPVPRSLSYPSREDCRAHWARKAQHRNESETTRAERYLLCHSVDVTSQTQADIVQYFRLTNAHDPNSDSYSGSHACLPLYPSTFTVLLECDDPPSPTTKRDQSSPLFSANKIRPALHMAFSSPGKPVQAMVFATRSLLGYTWNCNRITQMGYACFLSPLRSVLLVDDSGL